MIWPLTWLVQLWHITIWPLTWLVQLWKALLAYINQEFVAIKWNCLEGTPVSLIVSRSPKGWVGRQQAHLSSGPLGFAEGSSTASFCGAPPAHLPPFATFWPTSLPSPNGWILSSMTDPVETGDSLLLFSCFSTSLPTPLSIFPQEMKMYWFYCPAPRTCLRSHLPGAGSWCLGGLHGWAELSCQPPPAHCAEALFTEHSFLFSASPTLYNGMLSGPDVSLVLSCPKVTSEWVAPRFRFRVKNRSSS